MIKTKLIAVLLSGCLFLGIGAGNFLLRNNNTKAIDSSKIVNNNENTSKENRQAEKDNSNNEIDNKEKENDSERNTSTEDKTNESNEEASTGNNNNGTSDVVLEETQNNPVEVVEENNTVKPVEKPAPTPAPAPVYTPAPVPAPSTGTEASDNFAAEIEQAIYARVNQERAAAGLPALQYNNTMQHYARIKSQDMGDRGYFDHRNPEGQLITTKMQADGVSYRAWGENIAYISGMSGNAQLATKFMDNWMNSSGHRANILSSNFSSTGIGVYKIGNTYYATQEFYR
jgi:uncharacterized protein YkwD